MKHGYLRKMILCYFGIIYTIALLILLASVALIQKKNSDVIQNQEHTLFKRQVSDYENLYTDMFNIANDIKQMTTVDQFALSSGRTYYSTMADVQKEIRNYSRQYQRNGYRIMIHKLNDDKIITENESANRRYLLPQIGLKPSRYSELLNELVRYNKRHLLLFMDDALTYITYKSYINLNLVIVINCPVIQSSADGNDSHPFAITIADSSVKDFRSGKSSIAYPTISPSEPDSTVISSRLDNKLCLQMRSHSYNIVYNTLSPVPLYAASYRVSIYLIGILILASVPIFLLVSQVSRRIYRPIDEFIQNIQMQNNELIRTVDTHRKLISQSILIKLFTNSYNPSTIHAMIEKSGISWLDKPCCLVIFDTPLLNRGGGLSSPGMTDVLAQYFSRGITCIYTELRENGICCVFPADRSLPELQQSLHQSLVTIEKEIGCTLSAFIAPESQNINTLSSSYNIASFMKEEAPRLPLKNIYIYSDYEQLFKSSVGYPFSIEQDLLYAVSENDRASAEKIIDEIFDIYISKTFYQKSLREMNIISLINTINRSIQKASITLDELLSDNQYLFLELKMASTSQELCDKVKHTYKIIFDQCTKNQSIRTEDLGQQLKEYINEHYSVDISLNDIADHFSLSPNYMSLIFKKTLNNTFKDYLNKFRCEKAREILENQPDIRISEVSGMIGIQNVNTFIRLFKKDCGMSPGQYQAQFKHL